MECFFPKRSRYRTRLYNLKQFLNEVHKGKDHLTPLSPHPSSSVSHFAASSRLRRIYTVEDLTPHEYLLSHAWGENFLGATREVETFAKVALRVLCRVLKYRDKWIVRMILSSHAMYQGISLQPFSIFGLFYYSQNCKKERKKERK